MVENPYTLIAFILAAIFLWANILLTYLYPTDVGESRGIINARFIVVTVVSPVQFIMVFLIHRFVRRQ